MLKKFLSHPYIAGRNYDLFFFILAPLFATLIGSGTYGYYDYIGDKDALDLIKYLAISITHFHLVLVFYRSHGNSDIFKLYPFRFIAVPILLFIGLIYSETFFFVILLLSIVWDAYHSSMQVFGIGRIYDYKAGSDPNKGRALDIWLNIFMHFSPIIIGVNSQDVALHLLNVGPKEEIITKTIITFLINSLFFLKPFVAVLYFGYVVYYIKRYRDLSRKGYLISNYKIWLFISVGFCNLYVWRMHTVTSAWISLNVFHAIQYFGIVWWYEKKRISSLYGLPQKMAVIVFFVSAMMYGLYVSQTPTITIVKLALAVSILHYWYDGFIWSTRKKQI